MARAPLIGYHEKVGSPGSEAAQAAMSSTLFWIVTAVVLVAEVAIIVTALRMRVATDPARGVLGTRPLEIVWTLLPALLVALVVAASYGELRSG